MFRYIYASLRLLFATLRRDAGENLEDTAALLQVAVGILFGITFVGATIGWVGYKFEWWSLLSVSNFIISLAGFASAWLLVWILVRIGLAGGVVVGGLKIFAEAIRQVTRPLPSEPVNIATPDFEQARNLFRIVVAMLAWLVGFSVTASIFPVYVSPGSMLVGSIAGLLIAFVAIGYNIGSGWTPKVLLSLGVAAIVLNLLGVMFPGYTARVWVNQMYHQKTQSEAAKLDQAVEQSKLESLRNINQQLVPLEDRRLKGYALSKEDLAAYEELKRRKKVLEEKSPFNKGSKSSGGYNSPVIAIPSAALKGTWEMLVDWMEASMAYWVMGCLLLMAIGIGMSSVTGKVTGLPFGLMIWTGFIGLVLIIGHSIHVANRDPLKPTIRAIERKSDVMISEGIRRTDVEVQPTMDRVVGHTSSINEEGNALMAYAESGRSRLDNEAKAKAVAAGITTGDLYFNAKHVISSDPASWFDTGKQVCGTANVVVWGRANSYPEHPLLNRWVDARGWDSEPPKWKGSVRKVDPASPYMGLLVRIGLNGRPLSNWQEISQGKYYMEVSSPNCQPVFLAINEHISSESFAWLPGSFTDNEGGFQVQVR
jgi:hypothetical protein